MGTIKQTLAGVGLICCVWLQAGCTEMLVSGTFAGAGEYYRYTTTNVAEKTLMGTVSQITAASRDALKKMDIQLQAVHSGDSETEVIAATANLDIRITMAPVTATATKVTVNAVQDHVIKDRATAAEILAQIATELDRSPPSDNAVSRIYIKNECHHAIDVIVHYLAEENESRTWQTRGWFNLASGQKKYLADNHNRYVYFYGETQQTDKLIWAGDFFQWYKGKRYGFFKADTGTNLVDYTQTFTCD